MNILLFENQQINNKFYKNLNRAQTKKNIIYVPNN